MNLDQYRLEFLDSSHQFVLIDEQGLILQSCNSLVDLTGYHRQSIFDTIPFLESFRNDIDVLENGARLLYPSINTTLVGRQGSYDISFTRRDKEIVLVIVDREQDHAKLQELQQERNQSLIDQEIKQREAAMKSRFLANMSHEIRTPMNIVIGYTNLLLSSSDLNDENRGFASNIQIAGKNLLVLINDILDLSKMEAGSLTTEIVSFDLRSLMNNLDGVFRKQFEDRKIDLQIKYEKDAPVFIKSDPVRINQILSNLISNALKFSYEGGEVSVNIKVDEGGQSLRFEVVDDGVGIGSDKLDKIFESFSQEEDSTTRLFGGTGLGLSIVKELCNLLDGSVSVSSKKGQGSVFNVSIPLVEGNADDLKKMAVEDKTPERKLLKGKRILVVEDYELNQMLIVKILGDAGIVLTLAGNGQEAVELAQDNKFDAILMDIHMPILNGFDATKSIIDNSALNADTPIIAMTALAFEEDMIKCYDAGMVAYISKPFQIDNLFSVLIDNISLAGKEEIKETNGLISEESQQSGETEPKVNLEFLEELANGNQVFIKEFLVAYIKEITIALNDMNDHFRNGNLNEFKNVVHKIKPTLEMIGLLEVKSEIENFEQDETTAAKTKSLLEAIQPVIEGSLKIATKMIGPDE